ncbi:hypothetical protein WR25_08341 [Diploscapter pachys]|uniref:ShKT domain-containing protein n=1 Tax=Diploscapter pachys TaxID=2018661 RepID=A0A2A2JTE6_9BILA|nr:hypothetical protein WR25_08341 [Diploscapter pachys]
MLMKMYCYKSDCFDSYVNCGHWANDGMCTNPPYRSFMTHRSVRRGETKVTVPQIPEFSGDSGSDTSTTLRGSENSTIAKCSNYR